MRESHLLPLVGLLLFSLIPGQLCEICEISKNNYTDLNPLINTMINSIYTQGIQAANVLLSLRLVGILNQHQEQQLIQQVKCNVNSHDSTLTSGQLALAILALGACKKPNETPASYSYLVRKLRIKFEAEIKNMGKHNGNPLTNYYQLSLDVLALCLFRGKYSITKVAEIFNPENKNFYFKGQFSVDTGAMAVLALTCVKKDIINGKKKPDKEDLNNINSHIKSLIEKILSQKKENGLLGNTYSTGEAMQALFVSPDYYDESQWDCQQTLDTVVNEIHKGAFHMPTAAAQILPALMGKTYLNVNKHSPCVYGSVTPPLSPSQIQVNYSVVIINKTYSINVSVAKGSVFLDVMKAAKKRNETLFRFTVEESSWGPYVTSVQGLKANNNNRTFWELLSNGKPLDQGVGSYVVHEGENLEVRWSTY